MSVADTPLDSNAPKTKLKPSKDKVHHDKRQGEKPIEGWQVSHVDRRDQGINWAVGGWFLALHLGLLAAPFTFTWTGLGVAVLLWWLTGGIGICMGFHRYFTHSGFKTYAPIRYTLAWLGGLAGEGSVVHWVASHRKHHKLSDQEGDPHSPGDGGWWSHVTWTLTKLSSEDYHKYNAAWAPDMAKDGVLVFLDKTFLLWHFVLAAILGGIGYGIGGWYMAASLVVWGMFVRLCFVLHATWFVNSASHMVGYRNYETRDNSRNVWWVALLTFGEGWHNNHHAYPRMARHGHRWWEVDFTWITLYCMRACGLVWDVVDYKQKRLGD